MLLRTVGSIREYSRTEYRLDAAIHILGILFAINASAWLIAEVVSSAAASVVVAVSVYCVGLLTMIGLSASYHLARTSPSKNLLRRFDQAAIFVMIAATYTPFAALRLGGTVGTAVLITVWLCATAGIIVRLLYPQRFQIAGVAVYLLMGWMIVPLLRPLSASVATLDLWLLIAGGLVYTSGLIFYGLVRMPYHKAVWHAFVLVAAILHFVAIAAEFAA